MRIDVEIPRIFLPLLDDRARYLGCFGGRGSGKSHFMAGQLILRSLTGGFRAVCIREVQRTLKHSSKRLLEDKLRQYGLGEAHGFEVQDQSIKTPGGGEIIFIGMQDSNAESVKSLENISVAWVEEAQSLSARSLELLRPTIRAPGSQIWFSWNARRKTDPVDELMRGLGKPTNSVCIMANWRDNPFFPDVLETERMDCVKHNPDQYEHIWEGAYSSVIAGAYYSANLTQAKQEGRIGRVSADPLLPLKIFVDIGGTGAKSDAFSMWVAQHVGREIRVLDNYEAVGQPMAAHAAWLRMKGYGPDVARVYLPHDGVTRDRVFSVSFESSFNDIGYDVTVVKNQGAGAAMARVEAGRRMFGSMYFNESTTAAGLEALGWYHEKRDDARQIGLGPEHDWASHSADSFGLLAVVSEQEFKSDVWRSGDIDYSQMDRGRFI